MGARVCGGGKEDGKGGRTGLVGGALDCHGDGGIVVFKAREVLPPYFASAEMAIVKFESKGKVEAFDV